MSACGSCGPGYASPKEAFYLAPKEKILYIPCIIPDKDRPDYLSTVDVDPESPTYQKVSDLPSLRSTDTKFENQLHTTDVRCYSYMYR